MSSFNFNYVQSLEISSEDNPQIDLKGDLLVITAQRGQEKIMITTPIPQQLSQIVPSAAKVAATSVKLHRGSSPLKGRMLPANDRRTGENNQHAKLTIAQVREIKELAADMNFRTRGTKYRFCLEIGKIYHVHHTTISNIINGTSWKQA